jgi:predicted RecA/RadA family phage recombinase
MAKNYVQAGVNLTLTAPANVSSGVPVVVGSIIGVAADSALSGEEFDLITQGVFELDKTSALAIDVGDTLYFHSDTSLVNKTSSGGTKIGVAVTAASNPSGKVNVRLNGSF